MDTVTFAPKSMDSSSWFAKAVCSIHSTIIQGWMCIKELDE